MMGPETLNLPESKRVFPSSVDEIEVEPIDTAPFVEGQQRANPSDETIFSEDGLTLLPRISSSPEALGIGLIPSSTQMP